VNLDSTLMNTDSTELMAEHQRFKKEIEEIYLYTIGYCMQIGDVSDTTFYKSIMEFRKDTFIVKLENTIENEFDVKSEINATITDGFKHLKYHFPEGKMPTHIVYMNSLFSSSIYCTETEIGIGMDRYLGAEAEVIKRLNPMHFYDWIKIAMDRKFLERDAMATWIKNHYVTEEEGNLAEQIIRWGKIIYLIKAAYPEMEDHIVMRYSSEDYQWAKENEYEFWKYLVDQKMLFKSDERNTMNMLNPGPTTSGLPKEGGPDRMGQFLGWQMVKKYMEKKESTLAELVEIPYNELLQEYEIEE